MTTAPSDGHPTPAFGDVTIKAIVEAAARQLRERGDDTSRLDAELLACAAFNITRVQVFTQSERVLDTTERATFDELVARRLDHEPVAYILGRAAFRDLDLHVDRRVLIPRPETELLVEWANDFRERRTAAGGARSVPVDVLDIGTGSGAIAIAVAHEAPPGSVRVTASDISQEAIELARRNAQVAGVEVDFRAGNLFEAVEGKLFDVVVSNPPYVRRDEADSLAPDVYRYEPHVALFVDGDDPQVLARLLTEGAKQVLRPGGLLAIEIGHEQADAVTGIFRDAGYDDVEARSDLQGIDRTIGGYWHGS